MISLHSDIVTAQKAAIWRTSATGRAHGVIWSPQHRRWQCGPLPELEADVSQRTGAPVWLIRALGLGLWSIVLLTGLGVWLACSWGIL